MRKLTKITIVTLMAGMLLGSVSVWAGADTAKWADVGIATGVLVGEGIIWFTADPHPFSYAMWPNIDAAQLAAEYMVFNQMKKTKDKWDPEPADKYKQAAENNGGGGGTDGNEEGPDLQAAVQHLPFEAASLQNVGIEALGIGPDLSEIATDETRKALLEQLAGLQEKESATSTAEEDEDEIPGAGSCSASYSVCFRDLATEGEVAVGGAQKLNEQNFGTAGITHAELGLKAVQQAMADDGSGGGVVGGGISSDQASMAIATGSIKTYQDLSGLVGTGKNTIVAMKIVALMNLELAQRLNQGNMMQGSALTIEGARAFPKTVHMRD